MQNAEAAIDRFSEKKVLWIFSFFFKKKEKTKKPKTYKWAESSKNIKPHFAKSNLFHKYFSGTFP